MARRGVIAALLAEAPQLREQELLLLQLQQEREQGPREVPFRFSREVATTTTKGDDEPTKGDDELDEDEVGSGFPDNNEFDDEFDEDEDNSLEGLEGNLGDGSPCKGDGSSEGDGKEVWRPKKRPRPRTTVVTAKRPRATVVPAPWQKKSPRPPNHPPPGRHGAPASSWASKSASSSGRPAPKTPPVPPRKDKA